MSSTKHLILGGVKSGKSRYAENRVKQFLSEHNIAAESVCLIATAESLDEAMAQRIEKHQAQRPSNWQVIEEPLYLAEALEKASTTASIILIDCLTLWLTNLLMKENENFLARELEQFTNAVQRCQVSLIMVSNETNMGIMPLGQLTRDYCDRAGILHQKLAMICGSVDLVVAGLPLALKQKGDQG